MPLVQSQAAFLNWIRVMILPGHPKGVFDCRLAIGVNGSPAMKGMADGGHTDQATTNSNAESSVLFEEGVPNFREHTVALPSGRPGTIDVDGLTGTPGTGPGSDYALSVDALARREGMTVAEVQRWLREHQLRLHHYGGREMQLVPERLHGALAHQGSATEMRN